MITLEGDKKQIELCTLSSGHWCIHVLPTFPTDAINVLFTLQELSTAEKTKAAKHLHRQLCHQSYESLRKALSVIHHKVGDEFLNCLKTVCEECTLCKRYAPTFPRPVVSNLFDPDKMRFNQVVSLGTIYFVPH